MLRDHEFDPVNADEEARRLQKEEFARRVRREVLRMERGEADEDIRADLERETQQRAAAEEEARRERRRRANLVRQFFSGTILEREGASGYYVYLLYMAEMILLNSEKMIVC